MSTVMEAAQRLGVSVNTVYRYVRINRLQAHRVGGNLNITDGSIRALADTEMSEGSHDGMITKAETARRLGVSIDTVDRLIDTGQLTAYKLGPKNSAVRIPTSAIDNMLDGMGMSA